jgi:hypothetical protein
MADTPAPQAEPHWMDAPLNDEEREVMEKTLAELDPSKAEPTCKRCGDTGYVSTGNPMDPFELVVCDLHINAEPTDEALIENVRRNAADHILALAKEAKT